MARSPHRRKTKEERIEQGQLWDAMGNTDSSEFPESPESWFALVLDDPDGSIVNVLSVEDGKARSTFWAMSALTHYGRRLA